jgi:hypothetical protein
VVFRGVTDGHVRMLRYFGVQATAFEDAGRRSDADD